MVKRTGRELESINEIVAQIAKLKLEAGFFDTAVYPDGTPVAYVAACQEYGTPDIPPRPFIRPTIAERRKAWADQISIGFQKSLEGKISPVDVLTAVGEGVRGDIRKTISNVNNPVLANATIKARRDRKINPNQSTKPLIDTGKMFDSVEFIVTEN